MEVASEEQIEQGLGSRTPPKVLSFALRIELSARAFRPALALHLLKEQSVGVRIMGVWKSLKIIMISQTKQVEDG